MRRPDRGRTTILHSIVAALAATIACSSDQRTPAVPTASGGIVVDGIVRADRPPAVRISSPPPLEAAVLVSVVEGPGQGSSTLTGTDGGYRLELPRGPFKL